MAVTRYLDSFDFGGYGYGVSALLRGEIQILSGATSGTATVAGVLPGDIVLTQCTAGNGATLKNVAATEGVITINCTDPQETTTYQFVILRDDTDITIL